MRDWRVDIKQYGAQDSPLAEKDRLYMAMEEASLYFSENLKNNQEVVEYLKSRSLEPNTIEDFRIGYVPNDWRELYNYLHQKGFSDKELELAGLVKKSEKGFYDRFRGRIMFPIGDSSGRVIAFSGRIFKDDGKSAKYLNSPDTPIFSKSSVLYGLDKAKGSIRKNNFSILVEGQMDLALSHQAGFKNTVATSGTALSDSTVSKENVVSNLGVIRRLSPNIVLAFDADKAGFGASLRAGRIALSLGMDVKVATMPPGIDPADLISKEGALKWREAIRTSKHIIEFLMDKTLAESKGNSRKAGRSIKMEVLPYVDMLESSVEKMYFIKKISDLSGIPEGALGDDLKKIEQELKYEKSYIEEAERKEESLRRDHILNRLIGIVLWQEGIKEKKINTEGIIQEVSQILKMKAGEILDKLKDRAPDLIFEAEVFYGQGSDLDSEIKELLCNLEEEYLKEELFSKMQILRQSEEKKEETQSVKILEEINNINSRIQFIKNSRLKK